MPLLNDIKNDFPIFSRNPKLIYLDSAATSQKPASVIGAVKEYYETINSNVHRGVYTISEEATELYEHSRKNLAGFVGIKDPSRLVYLRNTTEAMNLLSYTLGASLKRDDEILLTEMEHHSNIVPWFFLKERGVKVKFAQIREDFTLDLEDFNSKLGARTRIASFVHASNVLGTINDVRELSKMCRERDCISIVDAAQSVPHMPVDVSRIDCDFLAFSGHKMLGPAGIGALCGRKDLLEKMPPFLGGGEMIREVSYKHATWNDVPWKFEAGTQNVEGAVGLSAAVDYLRKLGMDKVRDHEIELNRRMIELADSVSDLKYFGPSDPETRGSAFSFNLGNVSPFEVVKKAAEDNISITKSIHPHDIAAFLDKSGIAVRSGHHCAMPLMGRLGVAATARASPYVYNTNDDIEKLFASIKGCRKVYA